MDFSESCIIVDRLRDNVAISKICLKEGIAIRSDKENTVIPMQSVFRGQRFAIKPVPQGKYVVQYGYPFGISAGIEAGDLISSENIDDIKIDLDSEIVCDSPKIRYLTEYVNKTFQGYKRENGRVGTRNYFLIVPTSQCASHVALQSAQEALGKFSLAKDFANIDGIVAIPNTEGCGCASNLQIDRFLRVLKNYVTHPNVGGALIIDLGCEQTNYGVLHSYLKKNEDILTTPTDWLTIQNEGGTQKTIEKAMELIAHQLKEVNRISRTACPIEHLIVGTECGASDTFSGITANPVIGNAVDKVIYGKGSAILSEIPEMSGTERILMERMRDLKVVSKFKEIIRWYRELAKKLDVDMTDNLVAENRAGGLVNLCIKSLGAIIKGGSTTVEDVLEYGERVSRHGLNIMQGPGNDMESVTGIVAGGATIICFSTGRGTVTGNAIAPAVKISSTSELYQQLPDDIDFDAGKLLERDSAVSIDTLGDVLLDLVISVASGQKTKSELNGQQQFQVWTAGKLSL